MIRSMIWRSMFGGLVLVMLSACAVGSTDEDLTVATESDPVDPAPSATAAPDEGPSVGVIGARLTVADVPSPKGLLPPVPCNGCGPYPEPWSAKSK